MARTARRVQSLLEDGEEMEDALEAVLSVAEDNGGTVAWEDVEGDVTSGQWGRMIEKGVLESDGDGFAFEDQEEVEEVLRGDAEAVDLDLDLPEIPDEVEDSASWTQWDKLAGATAVLMMVGYYFDPIQNLIGGVIDIFLGPLKTALPFYVVILCVALITGLYSALLQSNLMDMDGMSVYQERMKKVQEKLEEAKEQDDEEAQQEIQQKQMEMMGDQLGMFKQMFRPMVWIMLLTIPIFLWLWWNVSTQPIGDSGMVIPIAGEITWDTGIVGPMRTWIIWYIVCSIGFSQILRKSLNISASPTG